MRRICIGVVLLAGCISASSVGHYDAAPGSDDSMPASIDLSNVDYTTAMPVDLSTTDGPSNVPIEVTGTFHAGAVEGSANGIAVRGRFNWNAAVAGTSNGIAVSGSFR